MFYCGGCATRYSLADGTMKTVVTCELCGNRKPCRHVPGKMGELTDYDVSTAKAKALRRHKVSGVPARVLVLRPNM